MPRGQVHESLSLRNQNFLVREMSLVLFVLCRAWWNFTISPPLALLSSPRSCDAFNCVLVIHSSIFRLIECMSFLAFVFRRRQPDGECFPLMIDGRCKTAFSHDYGVPADMSTAVAPPAWTGKRAFEGLQIRPFSELEENVRPDALQVELVGNYVKEGHVSLGAAFS